MSKPVCFIGVQKNAKVWRDLLFANIKECQYHKGAANIIKVIVDLG